MPPFDSVQKLLQLGERPMHTVCAGSDLCNPVGWNWNYQL